MDIVSLNYPLDHSGASGCPGRMTLRVGVVGNPEPALDEGSLARKNMESRSRAFLLVDLGLGFIARSFRARLRVLDTVSKQHHGTTYLLVGVYWLA